VTVISVAFVWDIKTLSEPLTRSERREQEENEKHNRIQVDGGWWMEETGLNFDHLNRIICQGFNQEEIYNHTFLHKLPR